MARNRLEELSFLHFEGNLSKAGKEELLDLLKDEEARAYVARNALIHRVMKATAGQAVVKRSLGEKVMSLIEHSRESLPERVLKEIEKEKQRNTAVIECAIDEEAVNDLVSFEEETKSVTPRRLLPSQFRIGFSIAASIVIVLFVSLVEWPSRAANEPVATLPVPPEQTVKKPAKLALLTKKIGDVRITRDGQAIGVREGEWLLEGDFLETNARSLLKADYPESSGRVTSFTLLAGAKLKFGEHSSGKLLELHGGVFDAKVEPQKEPMKILTPDAQVTVLGTEFRLNAQEMTTRLEVREGKVKMEDIEKGKALYVETNEYAEVNSYRTDANLIRGSMDFESPGRVTAFTLVRRSSGQVIGGYDSIEDGDTIRLKELPVNDMMIEANIVNARKGSLIFTFVDSKGRVVREDISQIQPVGSLDIEPLDIDQSRFDTGKPFRFSPGRYVLIAEPYTGPNGTGDKGESKTISFYVR